jgi:hypothetical protein
MDNGYLLVLEQPGMDAFYIHPQIAPAYTGKIKKRSIHSNKRFIERLIDRLNEFYEIGLRNSLKRL